jgi:hypothetical protein
MPSPSSTVVRESLWSPSMHQLNGGAGTKSTNFTSYSSTINQAYIPSPVPAYSFGTLTNVGVKYFPFNSLNVLVMPV